MKILLYRYGSICEPDILSSFREFGFEVTELTREMSEKHMLPSDAVKYVSDRLMAQPADMVFSINFFPFLADVCNIFHIPYLCWIVDSPVMELFADSIRLPYNRVFLFDRCMYEEIHPLNPDCVFHLPLAVNCAGKQKVIAQASAAQRRRFSADISFVGSLYTEKCAYDRIKTDNRRLIGYLDGLMQAQLKVYGYYFIEECLTPQIVEDFKASFEGFYQYPGETALTDAITLSQLYLGTKITALERLAVMRSLSERFSVDIYTGSDTGAFPRLHNRGFAKTLTEMPIIFHESTINLNMTAKSIRSAIPLRCLDIMGCEGFMISNYQNELLEYFTPGEEMDVYGSMDELVEKCAYYLEHPNRCREIAHNGYEAVQKHFNYPLQLTRMFELAFGKKEP